MLKWEILLSQSGKSCYAGMGNIVMLAQVDFVMLEQADFVMLKWEILLC